MTSARALRMSCCADGRRLYEVLRGGRFVLLGSGTAAVDPPRRWSAAEQRDQVSDRWTLVRPDGYVGWAGAPDEFPAWADRYFGPRTSVASQATGQPREGVVSGVSGAPRMRVVKLASSSTKAPDSAVRCRGTGAPT